MYIKHEVSGQRKIGDRGIGRNVPWAYCLWNLHGVEGLHLRTGRIFLFVTALLLRPATTAHVGPDALVRAGEPCSPMSCDAPHRWAGEGTRPYVTRPDDPLASATTTDILLQF